MNYLVWFWLAATVLFGALEIATSGILVCIWFAVGALAAMCSAFFLHNFVAQLLVFLVVSALALVFTRPLVKKCIHGKTPTNADRLLGAIAQVTESIDNSKGLGSVYINGKTWSARSVSGEPIPQGTSVSIEALEGVKLMVKVQESH